MIEQARLSALHSLNILDSDPEPFFDALTRAARFATEMPTALISLVDGGRQWFKSQTGLEGVRETPRDISFCTWAILSEDVFEVEDASIDPQFCENPLVLGAPYVRHYVGAPIQVAGGLRVGTLCLLSQTPGKLTPSQRALLLCLAEAAAAGMEQRSQLLERVSEATRLHDDLQKSQALLEQTNALAKVGGWEFNVDTNELEWTQETRLIHGVPHASPSLEAALAFYPEAVQGLIQTALASCAQHGTPIDLTVPSTKVDGERIWVHVVGQRLRDERGSRLIGAVQDVSLQRAASDALALSESKYRRLFQHSMGLICTHTLEGIVTSLNPAASLSLGREERELIGRPLSVILPPDRHIYLQAYLAKIKEDQSDSGVMELVASDGSRRFWAYHNVLDTEADPPYVLGHAQDITTQHLQEQQLQELASRDPLTRCFNRRYLTELAQRQLAAWGCLVFDLDHFKEVNDTQGHAEGDAVLIKFAAFLESKLLGEEVVIRLGGDEFLVFVPRATIERMDQLETCYRDRADEAPIRFSGGCAVSRPNESVGDTINRADMKLYDRRKQERS
ncbi:diguanylate cyclase [Stenotrophomonas sp. SAM-B]|uniref:diguanylate cyclase n=1 Tax=Stenotrophomonas sp. SAM-B TaxID=2729141 RepID=UPI003159BA70